MWAWLRKLSLISFRMSTCLLFCRSQGRWFFFHLWYGQKMDVGGKEEEFCCGKVKLILQRIRKCSEFCGLGPLSSYYFFKLALFRSINAKRKELWETTVEVSKRLETGRKCGGKKWGLVWICKFEVREGKEGRAVRSDREDRQKQGRWAQVFEVPVWKNEKRIGRDLYMTGMIQSWNWNQNTSSGHCWRFNTGFGGCFISI